MQIREGTIEDSSSIARVQVNSYRTAYAGLLPASYLEQFSQEWKEQEQTQDWRDFFSSPTQERLFVAVTAANEVVGYATGRPTPKPENPTLGELVSLHVRKDYHRQGIGRQLVYAIANHLRAEGCASLFLTVLQGNPAQAFYARLGGVRDGRQEFVLEDTTVVEDIYVWTDIESLCIASDEAIQREGEGG